ncbi:MAG: hypothetical protein U1F81_01005 [Verrucomicrobiaceae bacterium]
MSGRQTRHSPAFTLLETVLMLMTLGIFVMLLAAVTRPLWWDHAKHLLGKDVPATVESTAKK